MNTKILWLIAARSGSKSIPNKNIKKINGVPLLAYRILTALKTIFNKEVWITTDSYEYAELAKEYGATVPYIRPLELANDNSTSVDVVLHAMQFANNKNIKFDLIGLLEPTSPFITTKQLEDAVCELVNDSTADSIVAVRESRPNTIFIQNESKYLKDIAKNLKKIKLHGRQEFKNQITPSGGFYISKWDKFLQNQSFYTSNTIGFKVDEISGLEIDEPIDLLFAEFIIYKNKSNINVEF